jgi:hypothetical protein
MQKTAIVICLLVALIKPSAAQFYSDDFLESKKADASANLQYVVSQQILPKTSVEIRNRLRTVRIETPLRRDRASPPFMIYSDPSTNTIVVPVEDLRFFSDLTILWRWFVVHKCETTPLMAYLVVAMTAQPGTHSVGGPLESFNLLEGDAIRDQLINKVSLRDLNTGMSFVLAHELGHLYYGDEPSDISIDQEERADAFAMNRLADAHISPFGIIEFFSAVRFSDTTARGSKVDSHPLSYARLDAIARRIKEAPEGFLPNPFPAGFNFEAERGRIVEMANEVQQIAQALQHDNFVRQAVTSELVKNNPPSTFSTACR